MAKEEKKKSLKKKYRNQGIQCNLNRGNLDTSRERKVVRIKTAAAPNSKHVKQLSLDVTRAQIKEMEKEALAQSNPPQNCAPGVARPKENEEQMKSPPAQKNRHVSGVAS